VLCVPCSSSQLLFVELVDTLNVILNACNVAMALYVLNRKALFLKLVDSLRRCLFRKPFINSAEGPNHMRMIAQ
jgi:hypothetical protein